MSRATNLLNKLEEGTNKGCNTSYWKKMVAYAQKKVPGATEKDVQAAEDAMNGSGSSKDVKGNVAKILELMNSKDLIKDIGSTQDEFEEFAKLTGLS